LADPKVQVIDRPVRRICADGVEDAGGIVHRADTLILGTGFRASRFLDGIEIRGEAGRSLHADAWRDGCSALLGMSVADFPNLFLLYGPNTNLGHNSIVFMLECQCRYLAQAWAVLREQPGRAWRVRPASQARYQAWLEKRLAHSIWSGGCRSWYRDEAGRITTNWPATTIRYWWMTRRFRTADFELIEAEPVPELSSSSQFQ
jgi:cation diffusion facilitator CzcD-associated flavoprotein CzcO